MIAATSSTQEKPPKGGFSLSPSPHMHLDPLAPPTFSPSQEKSVCHAYGASYRAVLAGSLVMLLVWAIRLLFADDAPTPAGGLLSWLLVGLALVIYMGIVLLRSQTTLTASTLSQDWFWEKKVALQEVTYVRFMRLRGWEWLIAPRLLVRAGHGPLKSFHAASPHMWAEFERWSQALRDRQQRT